MDTGRVVADFSDEQMARFRAELMEKVGETAAAKFDCIPSNRMRYSYAIAMLRKSRPAAVYWHCLECCGYSRKEVELCPSVSCALWKWRKRGGVDE